MNIYWSPVDNVSNASLDKNEDATDGWYRILSLTVNPTTKPYLTEHATIIHTTVVCRTKPIHPKVIPHDQTLYWGLTLFASKNLIILQTSVTFQWSCIGGQAVA